MSRSPRGRLRPKSQGAERSVMRPASGPAHSASGVPRHVVLEILAHLRKNVSSITAARRNQASRGSQSTASSNVVLICLDGYCGVRCG